MGLYQNFSRDGCFCRQLMLAREATAKVWMGNAIITYRRGRGNRGQRSVESSPGMHASCTPYTGEVGPLPFTYPR